MPRHTQKSKTTSRRVYRNEGRKWKKLTIELKSEWQLNHPKTPCKAKEPIKKPP